MSKWVPERGMTCPGCTAAGEELVIVSWLRALPHLQSEVSFFLLPSKSKTKQQSLLFTSGKTSGSPQFFKSNKMSIIEGGMVSTNRLPCWPCVTSMSPTLDQAARKQQGAGCLGWATCWESVPEVSAVGREDVLDGMIWSLAGPPKAFLAARQQCQKRKHSKKGQQGSAPARAGGPSPCGSRLHSTSKQHTYLRWVQPSASLFSF